MSDEEKREKGAKGEQHYKLFRCAACGREQKRYKSTKKCNCGGGLIRMNTIAAEEATEARKRERERYSKDERKAEQLEKKVDVEAERLRALSKIIPDKLRCFHPLCEKTEVHECRGCGLYWCGDHMVRNRSGTHSSLYCRPCDQPYRVWSSVIALYLKQMLDALKAWPK